LYEARVDRVPACKSPAITSTTAATPSDEVIADGPCGAPLRVYGVVEAGQAAEPFAPSDSGGRWSPPGKPCVYASLSPAAAMLEYLAHLEGDPPGELMLAVATVPPGTVLSETNEPSTWQELPYRHEVQQVGAAWL